MQNSAQFKSALRKLIIFKILRTTTAIFTICYLLVTVLLFPTSQNFKMSHFELINVCVLLLILIGLRVAISSIAKSINFEESDLRFLNLWGIYYNKKYKNTIPRNNVGHTSIKLEKEQRFDFKETMFFVVHSLLVACHVFIQLMIIMVIIIFMVEMLSSATTVVEKHRYAIAFISILTLYIIAVMLRFGMYYIEVVLNLPRLQRDKIWVPLISFMYPSLTSVAAKKIQKKEPEKKIIAFVKVLGRFLFDIFILLVIVYAPLQIYSLLKNTTLVTSSAVYVGIPFVLGVGLAIFLPKAKTIAGLALQGTTVALLLTAPLYKEGYICIIFAFPIFFVITFSVAFLMVHMRRDRGKLKAPLLTILIALSAMEGTTEFTSFPRENEVVVSKIVKGSIAEVRNNLANTPRLDNNKALFLKIFPNPVEVNGHGLKVGDTRKFKFVAFKHIFWSRVEGETIMKITESSKNKIKSVVEKDNSYVGHYLRWKGSEVELEPIDNENTKVTWKLSYHRMYDPYWYFGTLQKYAVKLVAEEMINHAATPRS